MNRQSMCRMALAVMAGSLPLFADAANYNFVEGGYIYRDAYHQSDSGFRLEGSANLLTPLAAFAHFSTNNDLNQFGFGGIFHSPLDPTLDLVIGLSYEHLDTGYSADSGLGLRAGVRWMLMPRLEVDPELRYATAHEDATSGRLNVLYAIDRRFNVQGAVQFGDDERFELGLRYDFGPAGRDFLQSR